MCKDCETQNNCVDCGPNTAPVMPPQNTQNCPEPLPCPKYTSTLCILYKGETISCSFESNSSNVITEGNSLENVLANVVNYFCEKINYLNTPQITIETEEDFSTSDLITQNGISYSQNGRHIMISNGTNDIEVVCNGNVCATYQVLGTGTVTFVNGSGRTLEDPQGAVIDSQYGTAALSFNSTTDIVLVNNV